MLLANAGVDVALRDHGVDERAVERGLPVFSARAVAVALAEAKAEAVSRREPDATVIGADQTLEFEGQSFAKPDGLAAARRQLVALSGQTHALHAAFAVVRNGRLLSRQVRSARLTMRDLTEADIDRYLDCVGPAALRSVGAYQIEGLGIGLFDRIQGDYFTILGLPMLPLLAVLRRLGMIDS